MTINDGKGIFDKFGLIDELLRSLNRLSNIEGDERKGLDRCGMIWNMANGLAKLKEGLKNEDTAREEETRILRNRVFESEKEVRNHGADT